MRRFIIGMAIIVLACGPVTGLAETNAIVVVEAKQAELLPLPGVLYRLAPGQLYQTTEPGPKERDKSQAWSTANEFVFRTKLRNQCTLPGSAAIQHKIGVMVLFDTKDDRKKLHVFVRADMQTVEFKQ